MRCRANNWAIVIACCGLVATATAQDQKDAQAVSTKIYNVSEFVLPIANYAYKGMEIPSADSTGFASMGGMMGGGGGGGMMGGGMGGMGMGGGGFGGGGMFNVQSGAGGGFGAASVPKPRNSGLRFTQDDLIRTIYATISPSSWDEVGGSGSISTLGKMLVVNQTNDVHSQLQKFLTSLREQGGQLRSIIVIAHWLHLEPKEFSLLISNTGAVDRKALQHLVAKSGATSHITCFDGQTVHIASGNIRSALMSVVPVVGQVESDYDTQFASQNRESAELPEHILAQVAEVGNRNRSVGYSPVSKSVLFGGLLQVTPSVAADGKSAVIDVHSRIVSKGSAAPQETDFADVGKLSRLDVIAQQFETTLRVPIAKPVLIGGSTVEPMSGGTNAKQLHLVLEVIPQ